MISLGACSRWLHAPDCFAWISYPGTHINCFISEGQRVAKRWLKDGFSLNERVNYCGLGHMSCVWGKFSKAWIWLCSKCCLLLQMSSNSTLLLQSVILISTVAILISLAHDFQNYILEIPALEAWNSDWRIACHFPEINFTPCWQLLCFQMGELMGHLTFSLPQDFFLPSFPYFFFGGGTSRRGTVNIDTL